MDSILDDVEDMLLKFILLHCERNERKDIWNGSDCLKALSMDAEEEIKDQLWFLVKAELNYNRVVDKIRDDLKTEAESDSDSEEEEEEEEENATS